MSKGGLSERLAIHLFAISAKLPKGARRDRVEWRAADQDVRDQFRLLARRAIAYIRAEGGRHTHDESTAVDTLPPPPPWPPTLCVSCGLAKWAVSGSDLGPTCRC